MATPQTENGYTRIASEILDALARIRIPGEAMQIFWVVLRKTYGFQKKEDAIALSQFCLATGITKPNVCAALKKLKEMNLITQKDNAVANVYSINKDYTTWKPLPKKITLPKKIMIVTQKDNEPLPKKLPTKDNITKDNITKDNIYSPESKEYELSELLLSLIRRRDPKHKQPNLQKWSNEIGKLINKDKRTPEEIEAVIVWCQKDIFWQNNVLSTSKLREKFGQLKLKMESYKIGQTGRGQQSLENQTTAVPGKYANIPIEVIEV